MHSQAHFCQMLYLLYVAEWGSGSSEAVVLGARGNSWKCGCGPGFDLSIY